MKQFLPVLDDMSMPLLKQLIPSLQFIEIIGMVTDDKKHVLLSTHAPAETPEVDLPEPVQQEPANGSC